MKIIIKCSAKEIAAMQNILNGGGNLEDLVKRLCKENSKDFEIKSTGTMSDLIKELGLKVSKPTTSTAEDLEQKEFQVKSECSEDL